MSSLCLSVDGGAEGVDDDLIKAQAKVGSACTSDIIIYVCTSIILVFDGSCLRQSGCTQLHR